MSVLPARLAMAATGALSRTSSLPTSAMPSLLQGGELASSMSVANHGRAFARKSHRAGAADADGGGGDEARLPFRRSDMFFSLLFFVIARSEADEAIHAS
jgi:hypothetical protein